MCTTKPSPAAKPAMTGFSRALAWPWWAIPKAAMAERLGRGHVKQRRARVAKSAAAPRTSRESEAFAWSPAMNTLLRYASSSRRQRRGNSQETSGGARRVFNQRYAVRVMYSRNWTTRRRACLDGCHRALAARDPASSRPAALADVPNCQSALSAFRYFSGTRSRCDRRQNALAGLLNGGGEDHVNPVVARAR